MYALICKSCFQHNGLALKEEFEYLEFKCAYCHLLNPARLVKIKLLTVIGESWKTHPEIVPNFQFLVLRSVSRPGIRGILFFD